MNPGSVFSVRMHGEVAQGGVLWCGVVHQGLVPEYPQVYGVGTDVQCLVHLALTNKASTAAGSGGPYNNGDCPKAEVILVGTVRIDLPAFAQMLLAHSTNATI